MVYHLTKFSGQRRFDSGDVTDPIIDLIDGTFSLSIASLPRLIAIRVVVVDI